jgi:hypothetical protein
MQDQELRSLTAEVSAPGAMEPFGVYLFGADEPGAELGRYVERKVFLEAFGDSDDLLDQEYGPYDSSSWFIVAIDHLRHLPVGVLRIVRPSSAGLKSLHDLESVWGEPAEVVMHRTGIDVDQTKMWDIGTLAVLREYRRKATGGLITMGLYQTLTLAAFASGIELFVTIFDMPVFRLMRWKLHMIFAGYPGVGPRPYLGSPAAIPAWCAVADCEKQLATTDPDLHAILCKGIGLEPAMRPADLGLVLREATTGAAAVS